LPDVLDPRRARSDGAAHDRESRKLGMLVDRNVEAFAPDVSADVRARLTRRASDAKRDLRTAKREPQGEAMKAIVLLRHGESVWNGENRFTGWTDVDLTEQAIEEAKEAGRTLKAEGFVFDFAFTSVLKRAIRTLWIVLDEMDLASFPCIDRTLVSPQRPLGSARRRRGRCSKRYPVSLPR
jgi:hypothetical protein